MADGTRGVEEVGDGRVCRQRAGGRLRRGEPFLAYRVRPHRRFRDRGTEHVSKSGMKRMSGGAKRPCDGPSPILAALQAVAARRVADAARWVVAEGERGIVRPA